jgi:tRNA (mo5U34)-methyltransferase
MRAMNTLQIPHDQWFYEFTLPDGTRLPCRTPAHVLPIHATRNTMLKTAIQRAGMSDVNGQKVAPDLSAIDIACHQGYFSAELARMGFKDVLATDARAEHIRDASFIASAMGLANIRTLQSDLFDLKPSAVGQFDLVLLFGLLYHVENPVGALRVARALTRKVCVIETQIAPSLSGVMDWGSFEYVKPMHGSFAVIDESTELDGPEMSVTGICLCPSLDALLWILKKVGFRHCEVIETPAGGYEQHRFGKRAVVSALV